MESEYLTGYQLPVREHFHCKPTFILINGFSHLHTSVPSFPLISAKNLCNMIKKVMNIVLAE